MCRAIRVAILAEPSAATDLRASVGAEAEVACVVADVSQFDSLPAEIDVALVDGTTTAETLLMALLSQRPRTAVVWATHGAEAPTSAHVSVPYDRVREGMPSAIVKALIARR